MKHSKLIIDKKNNHTWEFTALDEYTLYLKETAVIKDEMFFNDLSNELWVFSLLEVQSADVFFKVNKEIISFPPGCYCFFKPPFGLTEIGAKNSQIILTAILSKRPLPKECPTSPTLFSIEKKKLPENYETLFSLLENLTVLKSISRYSIDNISGIAIKVKRIIEEHYRNNMNLREIAEKAGISQNLMSMYFKKSFFCTPSEYRKQLRVKSSVFELLESASSNKNIADIAFDCGYNDLSRYNKQFKAFTGVTPRQVKM